MRKRTGSFLNLSLITLLILGSLTMVASNSEASRLCPGWPPTIPIYVLEGEEEQVANVKPGEANYVIFPCYIEVRLPVGTNLSYIDFYINATTNHNWPVTVSPKPIRVKIHDTEVFEVNVTVPAGTLCNVTDKVFISGNASAHPGNTPLSLYMATGKIRVAQYYDAEIKIVDSYKTIDKADKRIVYLDITNKGNGKDKIRLNIENLDTFMKNGIEVYLPDEVELEVNESKIVDVIVKTSSDTKKGEYDLYLNLTSELDSSYSVYSLEEFKLSIQVQQNYTPYFVVGFAVVIGIITIAFFKKKSRKV